MQTQISLDPQKRKAALDILAAAPAAALAALWHNWAEKPKHFKVRGPEIGLVMVRGRAGGGGAPFNLGEATVSRASVRLESGEVGHGYCLGRDMAKAEAIAVIDALFQRQPQDVEAAILAPLRQAATETQDQRRAQAAATKVDFFTMVRGDN